MVDSEKSVTVFVGLGANLGDRLASLQSAVEALAANDFVSLDMRRDVAPLYETSPVGVPEDQPHYYNSVVRLRTRLAAPELLAVLLDIETALGRTRDRQNEARVIDLDLLLYGTQILRVEGLVVPHPRMHERLFVLEPLATLAPDFMHPVIRMPLGVIAGRLQDQTCNESVIQVFGPPWHLRSKHLPSVSG